MDKTHHGPVIGLFLYNLAAFLAEGIFVASHFSLLLTHKYILAIQEIITRSICDTLFDL